MSKGLPKVLDSFDSLTQLEVYCQDTQKAKDTFIFRGQNKNHSIKSDGVNSTLYRWGKKAVQPKKEDATQSKEKDIVQVTLFNDYYQPPDMEKDVVKKARRVFIDGTSNRNILTALRHLRGHTNLIDFSRNLYVALFFASNGKYEKDGELILIDTKRLISTGEMKKIKDIDYDDLKELALMEPGSIKLIEKRVSMQRSVFVYAKKGYIEREKYTAIPVAKEFKKKLLKNLSRIHKIHIDSIYNDPMGFVENERNYETAPVHFYWGNNHTDKAEYTSAIKRYTMAIKLKPNIATAYFNRGNVYKLMTKYKSAIADYTRAIKHKSDYVRAYNNRGGVYLEKGEYDFAIEDFTKAIALKSDDPEAYNNLGLTYRRKDEYGLAIKNYTKAIELKPDLTAAYLNRGSAYLGKDKYDLAIADCNKAIVLKPDYAYAYFIRGGAYMGKDEYDSAIADCSSVIYFKPDFATAYYNRGILFLIHQEWNDARSDLNRAQEKGIDMVEVFKNGFGTVAAFEKKYKIKVPVPDDIAKMLEGK